jgi:hypothetical protein
MADIQPQNTDTIRVNTIKEKTAASGITLAHTVKVDLIEESTPSAGISLGDEVNVDSIVEKTAAAGISLNSILKVTTAILQPLVATLEIGTSTVADHVLVLYVKTVKAAAAMLLGPTSADKLEFQTNSVVRQTLTSTGTLKERLSHTGYASGGEIESVTGAIDSTSTTPVTLFTYTIGAANTQVMIRLDVLSRDNSAASQSYLEVALSASRAGAGAVAGTVTVLHTVGVALHTVTMNASGNDIQVRVQNVSGTNTTSAIARATILPVSTSA